MTILFHAVHPVLAAHDVTQSLQFYASLGFRCVFVDDHHAPRYAAIQRDGVELHLQWTDAAQWQVDQDRPVFRFLVSDVDALFAQWQHSGVIATPPLAKSPWAQPGNTPWGTREFHLHDPAKNGLQFYQPRSE